MRANVRSKPASSLRALLEGGDRRSIARSTKAQELVNEDTALVVELAALTGADDWLVVHRAFDLLEKIAHEHRDWIEPHKGVFIGPHALSDKWEIRLNPKQRSESTALQARARAIRQRTR